MTRTDKRARIRPSAVRGRAVQQPGRGHAVDTIWAKLQRVLAICRDAFSQVEGLSAHSPATRRMCLVVLQWLPTRPQRSAATHAHRCSCDRQSGSTPARRLRRSCGVAQRFYTLMTASVRASIPASLSARPSLSSVAGSERTRRGVADLRRGSVGPDEDLERQIECRERRGHHHRGSCRGTAEDDELRIAQLEPFVTGPGLGGPPRPPQRSWTSCGSSIAPATFTPVIDSDDSFVCCGMTARRSP